ncbi:MAG: response regulator [Gemmatimonadaceae bacterium]
MRAGIAIFDALASSDVEMPVVLFVDDEASMRRVVQHALSLHGVEVHAADGLAGAQRQCERHAFDGAIIDVWLGDGSGFELYAWLQEHHPRVARNTVFVTGDIAANADLGRSIRALGRPVLVKPFDFRELEDIVRGWSRTSGPVPAVPGARAEPR